MPRLDNTRHERFAVYVADGKAASAAYKLSGFNVKGNSAETCASRLLRNAKVAARIAEIRTEAEKKLDLSLDRVYRELALLGFANMQDFMRIGAYGDPYLDFSTLTRDQAAALQEVTVEDFKEGRGDNARDVRRVKFKLADKRGALIELAHQLKETEKMRFAAGTQPVAAQSMGGKVLDFPAIAARFGAGKER